ncbi:MAG: hypothetical protein HY355_07890 [Armatimonadetes bacterium]|nr:hypothetical protein [Armatimonadota bacterium]
MRWGVVAALALLALWPLPAAADDTAGIAKNLAENILGRGLVRSSRVIEDGRTIEMVWESATYKPANSSAFTRELLEVEAKFASEAIFRVLAQIRGLQFEIMLGKRSLCSGRASRDRPFRIIFARDLGG